MHKIMKKKLKKLIFPICVIIVIALVVILEITDFEFLAFVLIAPAVTLAISLSCMIGLPFDDTPLCMGLLALIYSCFFFLPLLWLRKDNIKRILGILFILLLGHIIWAVTVVTFMLFRFPAQK